MSEEYWQISINRMVFSSLTFIFPFLLITLGLYFTRITVEHKNAVLLIASLIFYSWGEPRLIVLMILVSLVAFWGGLLIDSKKNARKFIFVITVFLITLNLIFFKYLNFIVDSVNSAAGLNIVVPSLTLPIGISFYTFQILSYVIDLYRGEVPVQKNFFRLLLYVCLFPQLIAGPIVRYSTVAEELTQRKTSFDDFMYGTKRFIIGLAKKLVIANNVAKLAEIVYAGDPDVYGTLMYWLAAVAYSLQLYFDFSAYSDMAIGIGRMTGFHFLENFNYPYVADSVTDFWRRWHISLSTWFRDYIYIPLGGNRVGKLRNIFNLLAVWALTGLWHGASWNFVLWGLYYGVLLIAEKFIYGRLLKKLPVLIRWLYTAFIVIIGWVIFNLTDFNTMFSALKQMFVYVPCSLADVITEDASITAAMLYMIPAVIFAFPSKNIFAALFKPNKKEQGSLALLIENIFYIALFVVCIIYLTSSQYNPFIYFRF